MSYQENFMFQQRRSDPNIKFSSSYPSSIKIIIGSLVSNTRQLASPEEFSVYKTCKAMAAAGSEYGDSEHGEKYSPGDVVERKTQLTETELDTRMESL